MPKKSAAQATADDIAADEDVAEPTRESARHDETGDLRSRLEAAEKKVLAAEEKAARREAEAMARDAKDFAARATAERKILPAAEPIVQGLYLQAAKDDAASPLASPLGGEVAISRVAGVVALVDACQAHTMTTEVVGGGGKVVLLSNDSTVDADREAFKTAVKAGK